MKRDGHSSSILARCGTTPAAMFRQLGPDKGFDSIGDFSIARPMSRFFDRLDSENRLAKTILYNLNPADNEVMATMAGNFNDGRCRAKCSTEAGGGFLTRRGHAGTDKYTVEHGAPEPVCGHADRFAELFVISAP
jgi:hypothetical protein